MKKPAGKGGQERVERMGRKRGKRPVQAHSTGGNATHNLNSGPGELEITVWGTVDKEPDRKVALVLGEDDARRLVANLGRFGFYA